MSAPPSPTEGLRRLDTLVSPLGGVVSRTMRLPPTPGEPPIPVYSAALDDVGAVHPAVRRSAGGSTRNQVDGAGAAADESRATGLAIAEALERYATCVFSEEQFVWATARGLDGEALDLETVPRCSAAELANPNCPVRPHDPDAPIRWVRGVSLRSLEPVWVPAVLTYLHILPLSIGERFCLPISTGCAAHTSLAAALVSALCEVVERDAIAVTWLQQLPLPEIDLDATSDELSELLELRRYSGVEQRHYDATTDLGIPTVYCLDLAPANAKLAQMVTCCTALDPVQAVAKTMRESAASRIGLSLDRDSPGDPDHFSSVYHGADYMGRPERREAFAFLTGTTDRRSLASLPSPAGGDTGADLRLLLGRLEAAGLEAFAVELTTDEAADVGFRVVRVIVPGLQPLSFSFRARFLAHPRLYAAPRAMGYPVRSESELNPWPQPFA